MHFWIIKTVFEIDSCAGGYAKSKESNRLLYLSNHLQAKFWNNKIKILYVYYSLANRKQK